MNHFVTVGSRWSHQGMGSVVVVDFVDDRDVLVHYEGSLAKWLISRERFDRIYKRERS